MESGLDALRARLDPVPEGPALLGFSGGADSVALLRMTLLLREEGRAFPEAIHVNHGLRGEESDGDQAFVEELCERLEVPLHAVRIDLGARRDENAAREAALTAMKELYGEDAKVEIRFSPRLLPGPAGKYRRTHTEFEFDEWALTEGEIILAQ